MAAVQPPRKRRARQSEAEECEDDAWSLCFADERPYSDSSDDDDDDEEVRRLEAALAAAKAKKKRRRGSGYDTLDADALTKHWSSRVRGDDEAYFRQMRRDHMAAMGIPLSDSEPEDDGSDSEEGKG